jgi:hypothetical protein
MVLKKGEKYQWSEERLNLLITKYDAGDSIMSISRLIGRPNRDMINAKIRELNLPRRDWVHEEDAAPSAFSLRALHTEDARKATLTALVFIPVKVVVEPLGEVEGCSWVANDGLYCDGLVARGKSYCATHHALVFRSPCSWEDNLLKGYLKHV